MAEPTPAELAKFIDGPALAGIFMNVMLYGVMMTQIFFYYSTYRDDPRWMKYYIAVLFLADTLNSIFNMWWIYNVLVNNFGNVEAVTLANWLFETEEALAGIIGTMVQMFYAWRIHKLTHNRWLVAAIVVPSIIGGLSGIGTSINVALKPLFTNFSHYKEIVIIWLAGAALADIIITSALIWHLRRSRTGFAGTDSIITRIVQLTMSNGLLTASFALADIIAFVSTDGGLHLAFNYTLCKLYGNSMMSSLNSRAILASSQANHTTFQVASSDRITSLGDILSSNNGGKASRPTQVVVNVETHEMVDITAGRMKADDEWSAERYGKGDVVV